MDLRAGADCIFLSLGCQGISSATVDLIVTMGSYRALFHFLNSLQTCMKSFLASSGARRCISIGTWYEKTSFANSHGDKCKNINIMMKKNI